MSKHKEKIEKIFEHPISGNLDFNKLIRALEHFGVKVDITKHNKAKIFFKNEELVLPIPHDHMLSKDTVVEIRHFLEKVGLTPEKLG